MAGVVNRAGGEALTVRRLHTLRVAGAPSNALALQGAHVAGGAAVSLRGTNLAGRLPAGCKLQITGNAAVYTTQADATATAGALMAVPVLPVLAASHADGAVVTVTQPYGEVSGTCADLTGDAAQRAEDVPEQTARQVRAVLVAGAPEPVEDDLAVTSMGAAKILRVRRVGPADFPACFVLFLGKAA